jgi:hypothetical protein
MSDYGAHGDRFANKKPQQLLQGFGAQIRTGGLWPGEIWTYKAARPSSGCLMPYKVNEARRHKIPRAR